ncbi:hypothetical protein ACFX1Z_024257 [Malus domestica]
MDIPNRERATHQGVDQHETSLNPAVSTRNRRSGGRHLIAKGLEGSTTIYHDCQDFLKQRQENPLHISSEINDPRVSERLGPLPRPRPAANLGNERQVPEEHKGTGDSEVFGQTRPISQYGESKEKPHPLAQTFLLPRGDEDLQKDRHLIAKGLEGSTTVYHDCQDFLKQRQENPVHISSEINDPRVSERLSPLPRPRPAANLGNERQVPEEHKGTGDSEVFGQTRPISQYGESKEKPHPLAQTFLLPRGDEDLRKKIPVMHDSTQNPLILQLLEEENSSGA